MRRRRWLAACAAGVLAVAGCTAGPPPPAPSSSVSGASGPASASGHASAPEPTAEKVFSDEELMALMDRAINSAGKSTGRVAKTGDLRTRLETRPDSVVLPAVEPAECGAFRPRSSPTGPADLEMNFAAGVLTLTGEWSRDAVAFVLARSAPRDDVVGADFAYNDEQSRRCSTFLEATEPDASPSTVRLFSVPAVGERAYATVVLPPATAGTPPAGATVALQALLGNVSFGLSRQAPVGASASDDDLATVIAPLVRLAKTLVAETATSVAPGSGPSATGAGPHLTD